MQIYLHTYIQSHCSDVVIKVSEATDGTYCASILQNSEYDLHDTCEPITRNFKYSYNDMHSLNERLYVYFRLS